MSGGRNIDAVIRLCLILVVCTASMAHGLTRTWTGTGNWSTDGNWSGGLAPTSVDDVLFDATSLNPSVIDAGFAGTVKSVTINASYTNTITQNRDLIVTNDFLMYGAIWRFTAGAPAALSVSNNMLLTNCTVYCERVSTAGDGTGRVFTVGGNLTVATNSTIDGIGLGFAQDQGPGSNLVSGDQGGGGHGGDGGYWPSAGTGPENAGRPYGSIVSPISLGSGGDRNAGGSALRLIVTGTTRIDGIVTMDGASSTSTGGGAGGSIWLTTDTLVGDGLIRADGGLSGTYNGYGYGHGGGGRIAVHLSSGTDTGGVKFQAASKRGALNNHPGGGAGTIYILPAGETYGTCIIDNNSIINARMTSITTNVTDTTVGDFVLRNAGEFIVDPGVTFTVHGNWTNAAGYTDVIGGTVLLAGTNTVNIDGSTTFGNLVCTNADKHLIFTAGDTFTIDQILTLRGTPGNELELDSSAASTWNLVIPLDDHDVWYVDVAYSDASGGSTVESLNSSNAGNNVNWVFGLPDQTNTWIGVSSTVWSTDSNWDLGRAPIAGDHVVVSNPCSFYPVMDISKIIKAVTIQSGASLSLNGKNLQVNEATVVAGTLTASGSELVALRGDVTFAGGTNVPATSTVRIEGTIAQSITTDGNPFYQFTIVNTGALVTVTDTLNATNLTNQGADLVVTGNVTVGQALATMNGTVDFLGNVLAGSITHSSDPVTFWGTATVTGNYAHTTGTLIFKGDVVAGGDIASQSDTVDFRGTLQANGLSKDAGDLSFSNDVTLVNFTSIASGDTITFAQAKTVAVTNLSLFGTFGNQLLLRSSSGGSYWNLSVKAWHSVGHVDVQDSFADGGMTIYPIQTTNSGHNSNWNFSDTDRWQSWDGSSSADFNAADNWSPTGTPDNTSWLVIDGDQGNAPVISGVSTAAHLVVGGGASATLTVNASLTVTGDVSVLESGTITHSVNNDSPINTLDMTVTGDLFVDGEINVDGRGYAKKKGPGAGTLNQGGGGHGGGGGDWGGRTQWVGTCYGSITEPITMGSGGVNGAGGGAIRLRVTGATTVNGTISSSGADLSGSAAGAGGSIWLTTDTLGGSGTISADGGRGGYYSTWGYSHGGGGRVGVYLTGSDDFGSVDIRSISKRGANSSHRGGGAGSVYLKGMSDTYGTCIYDNRDTINVFWSVINTAVTDTVVGNLVLGGSTTLLRIEEGGSLTVNGDWTNAATFKSAAGGTVNFGGTGTNTVFGDSNFGSLSSFAANKTLLFEAGSTFGVSGYLHLDGPTLRSTVDNSEWYLTLSGGSSSQLVENVMVRDSNASGGDTIYALPPSANLGGNTNWVFLLAEGTVITIR